MKNEKYAQPIAHTGKAITASIAERIEYRFNDLVFPKEPRSTINDTAGMNQMVIGPPNQHDTR